MQKTLAGCLVGVVIGIGTAPVAAQPSRRAERRRLIEEAALADRDGRHADALRLATEAGAIEMRAATRMFIAQQQLALGRHRDARASGRLCMTEALRESSRARQQVVRNCEDVVQQAESHLARVVVRPPAPAPEGLRVRVNNASLDRALWGIEHFVEPGEVSVVAETPERARFSARLTIVAGDSRAVTVDLAPPTRVDQIELAVERGDHEAVLSLATAENQEHPSARWQALMAVEHERIGQGAGQAAHLLTAFELATQCRDTAGSLRVERETCDRVWDRTFDPARVERQRREEAERVRQDELSRQRSEEIMARMNQAEEAERTRQEDASRPRPTPVGAVVLYGLAGLSAVGAGVFVYLWAGEQTEVERLCKRDGHGGAACPTLQNLLAAQEHQERAAIYGSTTLVLVGAGAALALGGFIWSAAAGAVSLPRTRTSTSLRLNISPLAGGAVLSVGGAL